MKKTLTFVTFLFIAATGLYTSSCKDKHNPDGSATTALVFADSLTIRQKPDIKSTPLGTLKRNTVITILKATDRKVTIDGWKDFWYQAKSGDTTGWVFGAYIMKNNCIGNQNRFVEKEIKYSDFKEIKDITLEMEITKGLCYTEPSENAELLVTGDAKIRVEDLETKSSKVKQVIKENGIIFFKPLKYVINENYGEAAPYIMFKHPVHGNVWIYSDKVSEIADFKRAGRQIIILSSSFPIIEGDRGNYRIIGYDPVGKKFLTGYNINEGGGEAYADCNIVNVRPEGDLHNIYIAISTGLSYHLCDEGGPEMQRKAYSTFKVVYRDVNIVKIVKWTTE